MCCLFETNVKSTFVMGIWLIILNALACFTPLIFELDFECQLTVVNGVVGAVFAVFLTHGVYGDGPRPKIEIVIWMIFAIGQCVFYVWLFYQIFQNNSYLTFFTFYYFGMFVLNLCAIFISNGARKEIGRMTHYNQIP